MVVCRWCSQHKMCLSTSMEVFISRCSFEMHETVLHENRFSASQPLNGQVQVFIQLAVEWNFDWKQVYSVVCCCVWLTWMMMKYVGIGYTFRGVWESATETSTSDAKKLENVGENPSNLLRKVFGTVSQERWRELTVFCAVILQTIFSTAHSSSNKSIPLGFN